MREAPLKKSIDKERALSPYDRLLLESVEKLGGFKNIHAHIDRADTLDEKYLSHINTTPLKASTVPLSVKQNLTGDLHRGFAYTEEDLRERMSKVIERIISYGTVHLSTCIDVATDIEKDGLLALMVALELKEKFKELIEIKVAPNPIFGFKEKSGRWEIFKEASKLSDFMSALPEKDEFLDPLTRDGKIGFRQHIKKVLELGCELNKEVHFHLDQANSPFETGTETLIEGLKWCDMPKTEEGKPSIWVIHMISPSCYQEDRFKRLIDGLLSNNIGVIVCPTAAISMRNIRPYSGPLHNSIARVLELCKQKVPVLIGTDNICDLFVPQSDGDMLTEIKMLGHAVRFATPHVLAKLGAGAPLNNVDRATIGEALYQDRRVFEEANPQWSSAVQ